MRDPSKRFAQYLQSWWEQQLRGATYPGEWLNERTSDELAREFRRNAQFEIAQAAFLHRRPSEEVAREFVDRLLPAPIEADAEVLTDAIVRAGATAQRFRATTAIGAVITVCALVIRNVLRGR